MTPDFSDEELRILAKLVRRTIEEDRFPLSPRLDPLRAILARLDPPKPKPERPQPLKPGDAPSHGQGRRSRR
jgi:hypothetical protein